MRFPCGDMFLTCKFIKDSHQTKRKIDDQRTAAAEALAQVKVAKKSLAVLVGEGLDEKIAKYDHILSQETQLKVDKSELTMKMHGVQALV